ncbi:MAG: hypothetical protein AAFW74_03895 [Pseudomonadota bacterium]
MQKRIMSMIAGLFFAVGALVSGQLPAIAAEPAQLTVIGKIENSNRSRFDPFSDAFFKFRENEFSKAFEFTYADLAALPQVTVNARAEEWPAAISATGPALGDVMKAAGVAPDAKLSVVALDGYAIELEAADRQAQNWILAIAVDGKPIGIGGRGPAWLMHDTAGKTVNSDVEGRWVWSVFVIAVE